MSVMKTFIWADCDSDSQNQLLQRPVSQSDSALQSTVSGIIQQVRSDGDQALLALAKQFDGVALSGLQLSLSQLQQLAALLPAKVKNAIDSAYKQIFCFHQAQQAVDLSIETRPGVVCQLVNRPIEKIGLYIPGGSAPLPSTVLMLGIPAQIAGNPQRILCTPPDPQGLIHPAIAYAALKCEISQVFTVGGAQAIAAMAYGTDSITPVDKIFGPGNSFVTQAKQQVANAAIAVAIDMPAGPSEVLVLADGHANPAFIAADLLSQAEHGPDSQVILVSDDSALLAAVNDALQQQLALLPRRDIAVQALAHGALIQTQSMAQAVAITNRYAPEHLIIQTADAEQIVSQISNASSIFVGPWSPESAGDYASGTNHVLPTYGYSKVLSSLSLADFCKRFTVQTLTQQGLTALADAIVDLAEAEGLQAHANAVKVRLNHLKTQIDPSSLKLR